ncbi:HEAT repeat domain-containing protein [Aquipseudomonas campi]|uniref:HEAT repeat domain-containing protein n=1 Tax=Aquipseudomonas campi TaxID=2731681 RepID=UPI003B838185
MRELQSLIQDLESPKSSIRDRAALDLMDIGDDSAIAPLLRAIFRPENVNHRGTLVYALSAFNCEDFLETLVDLALTGNFEVSAGACSIIAESATSAKAVQRVHAQLVKFNPNTLSAEHNYIARQELFELTPVESRPAP